jgi:hypothetical protein
MTPPVMTINDVPYIESKPGEPVHPTLGACMQCAFLKDAVGCYMAAEGAAKVAFGGDCMERDVIYVHSEQREEAA